MSAHDERLDGCAEYDADLLESAFAPTIDARLDAHLVGCARCRAARDRYLRTNDALSAALAVGVPESIASRASFVDERRTDDSARIDSVRIGTGRVGTGRVGVRRVSMRALAVAALLLALVVGVGAWLTLRVERVRWTPLVAGGDVVFSSADRARMSFGDSRFEVERGHFEVETPQGVVRASDAVFTLHITNEGEANVNAKQVGVIVATSVIAGVVWFVEHDGHETRVGAGETLVTPRAESTPAKTPETSENPGTSSAPETTNSNRTVLPSAPADATKVVMFGSVVDDATGKPLEGADIAFGKRDGDHALLARARSDAGGHFESEFAPTTLAELQALQLDSQSQMRFSAHHADYASSNDPPWFASQQPGPKLVSPGRYEVGVVRLSRGAVIAGRVTTREGVGVADAKVFVFEDRYGRQSIFNVRMRPFGTTNALGAVQAPERLASPRQGNWVLFASCPRGMGWTSLTIVPGRERIEAQIVLEPNFTLEVEARDEQGRPVQGVDVRAAARFPPFNTRIAAIETAMGVELMEPQRSLFSAKTDRSGIARVHGLPLVEGAPNTDTGFDRFGVLALHPQFAQSSAFPTKFESLHAGDTDRVSVVLRPIQLQQLSGKVVDDAGAAVRDVKVTLDHGMSCRTDAMGSFAFGCSPEQRHILNAEAAGCVAVDELIDKGVGPRKDDILLVLRRAMPITGIVVDEQDRPVVGARVEAMQGWKGLTASNAAGGYSGTDATGTFTFERTHAGDWNLTVLPPEPFDDWLPVTDVTVPGGARDVRIVMKRSLTPTHVEIDIVDAETGTALDALDHRLLSRDAAEGKVQTFSPTVERAAGKLMAKRVRPGAWRMWIHVAERPATFVDFDTNGGSLHLRAEVARFARITGRVDHPELSGRGDDAVYASRESVGSQPGGGNWQQAVRTAGSSMLAADGSFTLEGLMPGKWTVTWEGATKLAQAHVELTSGASSSIELKPVIGVRVKFRGSVPEMRGLVSVQLTRIDDPLMTTFDSDEPKNAEYSLSAFVRPGHWRYEIIQRDSTQPGDKRDITQTATGDIDVKEGDSPTIEVPLVAR